MGIHWSVYLIVGLLVTTVSAFVEGIRIFILAGIVFMAVGIIKFLLRGKAEARMEPALEKHPKGYIKCPHCHAWNYPQATICHFCKKRIRR